jgi:hypothetical protein
MACRQPPTFERYVLERLSPRSEAARMLADLAKDSSVSDAVPLVIESLPVQKSRELRQIVDLFEPYCEWVEDWETSGWEVERSGSKVTVRLPKGYEWGRGPHPRSEVIAAGAGVTAIRFEKVEHDDKYRATSASFRVMR